MKYQSMDLNRITISGCVILTLKTVYLSASTFVVGNLVQRQVFFATFADNLKTTKNHAHIVDIIQNYYFQLDFTC